MNLLTELFDKNKLLIPHMEIKGVREWQTDRENEWGGDEAKISYIIKYSLINIL